MKLFLTIAFIASLCVYSQAVSEPEETNEVEQPRLSCKLGVIGQALCELHCKGDGHAHGTCKNGVCHCSKMTFMEEIDPRLTCNSLGGIGLLACKAHCKLHGKHGKCKGKTCVCF